VDTVAGTADTVAEGSPYYFSWSPAGDELVAHVSERRLEMQTRDGVRTALTATGGGFGAPQWSADGANLVYGLVDAQGGRLVLGDTSGVPLRDITSFDERISFQLNAAGDRVAYVFTPDTAASNTLGPLYVTDMESGRTRELTEQPVWAFYWSPDGEKLAYLSTDIVDGEYALRWSVWDGQSVTEYARYLPTRTMLDRYLLFSDQYARSMRIWSPASDAFVYAGTNEAGRQGIWVQELGEEEARWVAGGIVASWSPQ
jgi:TolB protein